MRWRVRYAPGAEPCGGRGDKCDPPPLKSSTRWRDRGADKRAVLELRPGAVPACPRVLVPAFLGNGHSGEFPGSRWGAVPGREHSVRGPGGEAARVSGGTAGLLVCGTQMSRGGGGEEESWTRRGLSYGL